MVKIGNLEMIPEKVRICVPIMAKTTDGVLEEAKNAGASGADLLEFRADALLENGFDPKDLADLISAVRVRAGDLPILATIRTTAEGGYAELSDAAYLSLINLISSCDAVDAVDIEGLARPETASVCIGTVHRHGKTVVASNHDFHKTPAADEIVRRLGVLAGLGGDIVKTAFMPEQESDTKKLAEAGRLFHEQIPEKPMILIAMGERGRDSRIHAAAYGSVLTFAAAGNASAPGQLPAAELRRIWREEGEDQDEGTH